MANVPTQLSPGVNITEIDLSGIVREAGNNVSGFVGQFRWGPASENLAVDTERRFTDIFLPPTNDLPEKMQDDFFSVTNYFRYSDKLKIVRVVHENARNARAGQSSPAAPILIHNDEEFFAKADPTGIGAKNYSVVLANANWIARYPGDIGNSIEVRAVGAGTFVQGSEEGNANGGGGNETEPPVESETFFLPLIKSGSPVQGVTYALVTVPQITELNSLPALLVGGTTWASRFIGNGTTLPSGNTFGMKYLCFYLKGSSYCNNVGSFPIPGGSYAYITGSNAANGLTYNEYYRDRWFYGTFGVGDNETAGSFWTKEGPLLSAKLGIGLTFAASGVTWTRSHNLGKGFHQTRSDNHSQNSGMFGLMSPFGPGYSALNGGIYETYRLKHGLVSVFEKTMYPDGYYAQNAAVDRENQSPFCYERFVDEQTTRLRKPATHISNLHIANPWLSSELSMPIFAILPFDNNASAITEPVSNEFNIQLTYPGGNTAFGGITNAAYSTTRTATAYRNYSTGRVVYKWGGTGITNDGTDLANFPLRPVIDSFPGITAAGNKGMIIMMAFAQPVSGITTGILSTWHVGITTDSSEYTANNLGTVQAITTPIANIDGLAANGADVASSTNILTTTLSNAAQITFGLDGELDATFAGAQVSNKSTSDPNSSIATGIVVSNFPSIDSPGGGDSQRLAGQAIPFKQSEITQIFDLVIRKKDSN